MRLLRCAAKVLTTTFALYVELAEAAGRHSATDESLAKMQQLGDKHFGGEAARAVGVHYAVLELELGASKRDVHKAYKAMSLKHHPDKRPGACAPGADCAMQQRVGDAKAELEQDSVRLRFVHMLALPFCQEVRAVPKLLLKRVSLLLDEHEYEQVRSTLKLSDAVDALRVCCM